MKDEIPGGLRVIRVFAFLGAFFTSLFGLFSFALILKNPLSLAVLVVGLVFYISLILAINKHNKILFRTALVSLVLLIITSIALLIILQSSNTGIRILIEVALLSYLLMKKDYFSL